jgi:hypothetical protein
MNPIATVALLCATASALAADPVSLGIELGKTLPKGGTVTVVTAGQPGPGQKGHAPTAVVTDFAKPAALPDAGPFDVYFTPKGGKPVLAAAKWKRAGPGKATLALGDYLGVVVVRGDDLPRADAVVITSVTDPGPGEKGHAAVQSAPDYKADMAVPAGTYAVWVVPFNGAKAQRVADNVRVLAGRAVPVPVPD